MLARRFLLKGALVFGLVVSSVPAHSEPWPPCNAMLSSGSNGSQNSQAAKLPLVRRLGDSAASREDWLIELPNDWDHPRPKIERFEEVRDGDRLRLSITVLNDSPHASPDGGITSSFPELAGPQDGEMVERVAGQEDMAVHVILAGQPLYDRSGTRSIASNLMLEIQGSWLPHQRRTLQATIIAGAAPVAVQYRSALADRHGRYYNAPSTGESLDQQGWPVAVCIANGNPR